MYKRQDEVRNTISELAAPYAESMVTDALGNLIVLKKGGNRREKPLVVSAHMDEVGFLVSKITENGMIKFLTVGSIDPRVMIGRKMKVGYKKLPGVISLKEGRPRRFLPLYRHRRFLQGRGRKVCPHRRPLLFRLPL